MKTIIKETKEKVKAINTYYIKYGMNYAFK